METLASLLTSESLAAFVSEYSWTWPIAEIVHFTGLIMLVGAISLIDLRVLGVAKSLPLGPLHRFVPWGVTGFVMCLLTGILFVSGDSFKEPMVNLQKGVFQLKMLFMALAGANVLLFYYAPALRGVVESLGPGDDAPVFAKVVAGTSLVLWLGVTYLGRMLPYGDAFYFAWYW